MFVPNFKDSIPGYTGHRTQKDELGHVDQQQSVEPRKQIPGYGGYIPGIKSENVYGETYGKSSYASSAKAFVRGMEEPPHLKYDTTMKKEFVDHATRTDRIQTTAEIVGVNRGEDMYKRVSANQMGYNRFLFTSLFHQPKFMPFSALMYQRTPWLSKLPAWALRRLILLT
jgi:hypothetical protein